MDTDFRTQSGNRTSLRYATFLPLALLIASIVSSCLSYNNARQDITDDLNDAMIALANENGRLWARQDTIAALQHIHATTHRPPIYQASDVNFRNSMLKDDAYFTLALVDRNNPMPKLKVGRIASDSIIIVPEKAVDGLAIQVQGFADCSMATVFAASDQTLPGVLLTLSFISMGSMIFIRKEKKECLEDSAVPASVCPSLDGIKLTPMQRQLTQMLLDAPGRKVDKASLCSALWGNKSNADESLYTLVRRTKAALADSDMELICNRGDSYELRINI